MKNIMFIKKNPWADNKHVKCGLYNGYVAVPPTNKNFAKDDWDLYNVSIHGGVTYGHPVNRHFLVGAIFLDGAQDVPGDWWVIGFDTCHIDDTPEKWTKEAVIAETRRLDVELSK